MKLLLLGDISGRIGRQTVRSCLQEIKQRENIDFIIANGENAAGGIGITQPVYEELLGSGINFLTTGNHVWDKKEIFEFIDDAECLVRPANYPPGTPGRGYAVVDTAQGKIGIINLAGRTFMPEMDCPFRLARDLVEKVSRETNVIILDFHAEATSEKMALGWYLDGLVSVVVGTHTHIQTADERILPQGTAYLTDLGMCGPWNSVLGVEPSIVIEKFLTGLPVRFALAKGPAVLCGLIVDIDGSTGKANAVKRLFEVKKV